MRRSRSGTPAGRRLRRALRWGVPLGLVVGTGLYYRYRPHYPNINGERLERDRYRVPATQIQFLHDTSWYEAGRRHSRREILPAVTGMIQAARRLILLDVFLFNLHHVHQGGPFLATTRRIAEALAAKDCARYFITDPLNSSYGTEHAEPLDWLREAGVRVCQTDLRRLRDNNLLYSPLWRLLLQWLPPGGRGWLTNPLRPNNRTTLRAWLEALNARGNHRKVVIADAGDSYETLITSSNFEDASSFFINSALRIRSQAVARHFFEAERAVARMSGMEIPERILPVVDRGDAEVMPLMGARIKRQTLADLRAAQSGDDLCIAMLFLSDRDIIAELLAAAARGVNVSVILDQNRVSFGNKKAGFPNQFVAPELVRGGVHVRWGNTRKEEFHIKLMLLRRGDTCILQTGSANFTRRSLCNTNPEANVRVEAPMSAQVSQDAWRYLDWLSEPPRSFAADGAGSRPAYWWYRVQEAVGIATF